MESTYLLTVGAPSLYKFGFVLLLFVTSCANQPPSSIEAEGFEFDTTHCFVDAIELDSMSFASGAKHWIIKGLIVIEGKEFPYSMVYNNNPLERLSKPISVKPPACFDQNENVSFLLTRNNDNVMISWKTSDQFLYVRTVLTSER